MHFHMHQARAKYGIIYLLVKKILHSKHCGKRCSNGRAPRSAPTHLKTHKSASACVHLCICMHQIPDFLLAPINLRGILNPNPKGILPNCNSRPVCTETNISKQIQDKQILSDCWTSRVTSESSPLTTKGCWKLTKCTFEAHFELGIKPASPLSHIRAPTTTFGCQWWCFPHGHSDGW
jgi:hypothetical protein